MRHIKQCLILKEELAVLVQIMEGIQMMLIKVAIEQVMMEVYLVIIMVLQIVVLCSIILDMEKEELMEKNLQIVFI